ncbi:MAG: hypothetical protein R3F19_10960, partial [Verrucomicrobiales bacterium]
MIRTAAQAGDPSPLPLYDKDPQHLWNRLSSALTTCAPEGKPVPPDLLDPPYLDLLFAGEAKMETVALLNEFLASEVTLVAMAPIQRALMQRDLLAAFHQLTEGEWTSAKRELATALARAIRRVALAPEEIRTLPDNYAAATASLGIPTADDPAHPAPFLPKDLLVDDG